MTTAPGFLTAMQHSMAILSQTRIFWDIIYQSDVLVSVPWLVLVSEGKHIEFMHLNFLKL